MIYILDTDLYSLSVLPDSPEYLLIHAKALELSAGDRLVTTIITYEEQTRGWLGYAAKSRDLGHQVKAYARLKRHLLNYLSFEVMDFGEGAARAFERLRGLRVGTLDLKIAAIALSENAVVVTRNVRDFGKVPGLQVEGWTKS